MAAAVAPEDGVRFKYGGGWTDVARAEDLTSRTTVFGRNDTATAAVLQQILLRHSVNHKIIVARPFQMRMLPELPTTKTFHLIFLRFLYPEL
jgi:hypothetical protein